jgi:hypothetical protein
MLSQFFHKDINSRIRICSEEMELCNQNHAKGITRVQETQAEELALES